jgi:hypothetical protein
MVMAAVIIAIVVVIAIVLVVRASDDDVTVPPLTAAEKQAGAVRVIYPDRDLPDTPERVTIGGEDVTLYFVRTEGSGEDVTATLRVGTSSTAGSLPPEVTLQKGESETVNGFVITLLDAFNTGDPSQDAADVTVTEP